MGIPSVIALFLANKRETKKKPVVQNQINNNNNNVNTTLPVNKPEESELDISGFASETTEQEVSFFCKST